ncbi:hypothetical protein NN761_16635 [Bacteroides clarus]|jgi:hypothetical protein|uniref:hypothetical protein n=1 Tax=Bacteroides clarus TaxID=626929 RepID=UPI0018AC87A4|nr:hypothetical protein [Bacteroides clarus]MCQ1547192.1 hypothetical protein [Bacteroides clarus]
MYNTKDFEQAMHVCSYKLDRVFYHKKHSRFVQKVYGRVPIPKKVTISGERKIIIHWRKFRWNDAGQCFSFYSDIRKRKYDLPLRSLEEQKKITQS